MQRQAGVVYGNIMTVNGRVLEIGLEVNPEALRWLLLDRRELVLATLYDQSLRATSPKKAAWVMFLGRRDAVLAGYLSKDGEGEIFRHRMDLREEYLPLWDAVVNCGFSPEARWSSGLGEYGETGVYLCVRISS